VHRRSRDVEVRHPLVQEARQHPHEAALALALLAEEEEVVSRDDGGRELRQHGVVVADDAGEERGRGALAARDGVGERAFEVRAQLRLDGARAPAGGAKGGERGDRWRVGHDGRFGAHARVDATEPDGFPGVMGESRSIRPGFQAPDPGRRSSILMWWSVFPQLGDIGHTECNP
jgi:hypothetical protein